MQSWAGKCANRWLMWLPYSQLSQAASKWTWTGLVQFSVTENQTDWAMQLHSTATVSNPNSPGTLYRTQNVFNSQYPPFASICKVKGRIKKWVIFLQSSHTQHPLFLQHSSAFAVKEENKEFFFPCSSVRGNGEANMVPSTSDSQPNWAMAAMPAKTSARAPLPQTFPSSKCWSDTSSTGQLSHTHWSGTSWLEASAYAKTMWLEGIEIEKWIKIRRKIQEILILIIMH